MSEWIHTLLIRNRHESKTEDVSYLVPVPIIDGEGDTAGYISMTEIVTQTNLSFFDLWEERERDRGSSWRNVKTALKSPA